MSRLYTVEFQVENISKEEAGQLEGVINDWIDSPSKDYCDESRKLVAGGTTILSGGMDEEGAHKEIVKEIKQKLPQAKITTRWHYDEWFEWDETYTD